MACASSVRIDNIGVYVPLSIKQGGTFRKYFRLRSVDADGVRTNIDITGDTFEAQIRKTPDSATEIEFDCVLSDAEEGLFYIELTDAQTEAITAGDSIDNAKSRYHWDCEWHKANDDVIPLMWGDVKVLREITKD